MISFEDIKNNQEVRTYIQQADDTLKALGYTEHSFAHVTKVAARAEYILTTLGYSKREVNLAKIAAYLHDIGNLINRVDHSQSGAVMAFRILDKLGMDPEEISDIVTAIGNHDEGTGVPVNPIAAALILADKSDVRRTRVRNSDFSDFDTVADCIFGTGFCGVVSGNAKKCIEKINESGCFGVFIDKIEEIETDTYDLIRKPIVRIYW